MLLLLSVNCQESNPLCLLRYKNADFSLGSREAGAGPAPEAPAGPGPHLSRVLSPSDVPTAKQHHPAAGLDISLNGDGTFLSCLVVPAGAGGSGPSLLLRLASTQQRHQNKTF